jgi:hypothetical protein
MLLIQFFIFVHYCILHPLFLEWYFLSLVLILSLIGCLHLAIPWFFHYFLYSSYHCIPYNFHVWTHFKGWLNRDNACFGLGLYIISLIFPSRYILIPKVYVLLIVFLKVLFYLFLTPFSFFQISFFIWHFWLIVFTFVIFFMAFFLFILHFLLFFFSSFFWVTLFFFLIFSYFFLCFLFLCFHFLFHFNISTMSMLSLDSASPVL